MVSKSDQLLIVVSILEGERPRTSCCTCCFLSVHRGCADPEDLVIPASVVPKDWRRAVRGAACWAIDLNVSRESGRQEGEVAFCAAPGGCGVEGGETISSRRLSTTLARSRGCACSARSVQPPPGKGVFARTLLALEYVLLPFRRRVEATAFARLHGGLGVVGRACGRALEGQALCREWRGTPVLVPTAGDGGCVHKQFMGSGRGVTPFGGSRGRLPGAGDVYLGPKGWLGTCQVTKGRRGPSGQREAPSARKV